LKIFKFFKRKKKGSGEQAGERLRLVLVHDRLGNSGGNDSLLTGLKNDLLEVFKKYIDERDGLLDIRLTRIDDPEKGTAVPALVANIPINNLISSPKTPSGFPREHE